MRKITTIILMAAAGVFVACSKTDKKVETEADVKEMASADTAVMYRDMPGVVEADGAEIIRVDESFWTGVDYNAPVAANSKVKDRDVEVRSNPGYTIYSMEDKVLFDVDKANLRPGAEGKLKSIAASIQEVSTRGPIRIYGHTDSTGTAAHNKKLAEERANAVKNWLQKNTDIDPARLSVEAVGQAKPIASNETAKGRQQNRRVAIVVATTTEAKQ